MPELPEVETVIRLISRDVIGREILSTNIRWKRSIAVPSAAAFNRGLRGMRVEGLSRRGKYIIFSLRDNLGANWSMLVHLRMSGTLEVRHAPGELAKHDRVIFQFENGSQLHFNDTRKFGKLYLVREHRQVTAKLGPEPLTNELSYGRFYDRLQSRSGAIKPLLLKQDFIAGLGNIYVDESLWRSRIHPLTNCRQISPQKAKLLLTSIRAVLRKAIRNCGTDFGDGVAVFGNYRTDVYDRTDAPCKRCRTKIKKIIVAQRGTHYCPRCQKRPS